MTRLTGMTRSIRGIRTARSVHLTAPATLLACALAAGLPSGCATSGSSSGGGAWTDVSVVDEKGDSIAGEILLWSRGTEEKCMQDGASCPVQVAAGFYSMHFRKMRAGRLAQFGGTSAGGDKASGCLRARINLVPGLKITCRKKAEFNCSKGANETMDCGEAAASRVGYLPKPGDALDDSKELQ